MLNNTFMYDIEADIPNMWLRNTANIYDPLREGRLTINDGPEILGPSCPPTIEEVEQAAAFEIACR